MNNVTWLLPNLQIKDPKEIEIRRQNYNPWLNTDELLNYVFCANYPKDFRKEPYCKCWFLPVKDIIESLDKLWYQVIKKENI